MESDVTNKRKSIKLFTGTIILTLIVLLGGVFGGMLYERVVQPENTSSKIINTSELNTADAVELVANSVVDVSSENSVGSGVVYSKDGHVITNEHVIRGAQKIVVKLKDQSKETAKLIGVDPSNDIALIKINRNNLSPVNFASYPTIRLGETTIVIGNPLGELSGSVTDGVVSAKERLVNVDGKQMKLMQTCAEINSGNSGGGVFRLNGELAGIVVAKSSGENLEGLGFAIPSDDVKKSVEQILSNKKL